MKTCGNNVVNGAKDFSVNTVTNAMYATFDSVPGRFVTGTIDGMLDRADDIMDTYLPEEEPIAQDNGGDCSFLMLLRLNGQNKEKKKILKNISYSYSWY